MALDKKQRKRSAISDAVSIWKTIEAKLKEKLDKALYDDEEFSYKVYNTFSSIPFGS